MYFIDPSELEAKELFPGVTMRAAWGEKIMLSFIDLGPHSVVPEHKHPHEQMGIVLEGEFEFTIGGETKVVKAGEAYYIPSNVPHSVRTPAQKARALDIFSPPREEYK
ncbi:MAG: cupin domain-containing protein [Nitrospinota bacterium]|nr:MAG: cupin domain-containing protein [Nitrospinota bacterium]